MIISIIQLFTSCFYGHFPKVKTKKEDSSDIWSDSQSESPTDVREASSYVVTPNIEMSQIGHFNQNRPVFTDKSHFCFVANKAVLTTICRKFANFAFSQIFKIPPTGIPFKIRKKYLLSITKVFIKYFRGNTSMKLQKYLTNSAEILRWNFRNAESMSQNCFEEDKNGTFFRFFRTNSSLFQLYIFLYSTMNHHLIKNRFRFSVASLHRLETSDSQEFRKSKCQKWQNDICSSFPRLEIAPDEKEQT